MPEVTATTPAEDPFLVYADGVDSARSAPGVVAAAATTGDVQVLLGWTPEDRPWLASPSLRGRTVMAGYALAGAVGDRRLAYLPTRLSAVPRLLCHLRPALAVVTGVRRGTDLYYGSTVGYGPAATRAAGAVVDV